MCHIHLGIFRGLGDTSTPLLWALVFSGLNFLLDPLFMFACRMGASGAAAGTALSQTIALFGLLGALQRKLVPEGGAREGLAPKLKGDGGRHAPILSVACSKMFSPFLLVSRENLAGLGPMLLEYGRAGSHVFARSWGKVAVYALCSRAAAALGPVASAAHLLCFNLGVTLSQLSEAIAIATQTLLARALGELRVRDAAARDAASLRAEPAKQKAAFAKAKAAADAVTEAQSDAWHIIQRACLAGGLVAGGVTSFTTLRPRAMVAGLTTDAAVRAACHSILTPVLVCQFFKGLAYPANGIIMGGLDWGFASLGLWAGSLCCIGIITFGPGPPTLLRIWSGIAVFVAAQSILVAARVASRTGPWRILWSKGRTFPLTSPEPDIKLEQRAEEKRKGESKR